MDQKSLVNAEAPDPILGLIDRYRELWPLCPVGDREAEGRWNRDISSLEDDIGVTVPTTKAGALVALQFITWKLEDNAAEEWMTGILTTSVATLSREA